MMKTRQFNIKKSSVHWKQFTRHSDSVFLSLGREISIGVLSVATLLTATPCSAAGKMATATVRTSVTCGDSVGDEATEQEVADSVLLEEGDLLFNVVGSGEGLAAAIADVTDGIDRQQITHVAIVHLQQGVLYALEATGKHGVWLTPIDSFINNADHTPDGKPLILVGRLKDRSNIKQSVDKALSYLGYPYDSLYMPDDSAVYCSELVQLSYTYADGTSVFPQQPMSFHDKSGNVTGFWKDYYRKFGMDVPEGWPGTNPGGISKSEAIDIVYKFY